MRMVLCFLKGQWAGEIEILIDYQKAEVRQLKDLFPNWWGMKGV